MVPDIHAKLHNQPFIMRRAIWRHVFGHRLTHTHTIKPPTAGVQLVGHTSIIPSFLDSELQGVSGQAQIGFLTLLEHLRYCEVGQHVMTHCVIYLVQIESELIDFVQQLQLDSEGVK